MARQHLFTNVILTISSNLETPLSIINKDYCVHLSMSPGCYGILKALILQLVLFQIAWGLHLKGTFRTDEFFKFVTRFGFQKTDQHNAPITTGYIYGNFSLIKTPGMNGTVPVDSLITLAVMDYNYFIDYYNKRRIIPRSAACSLMFESINKIAYFFECNEDGNWNNLFIYLWL